VIVEFLDTWPLFHNAYIGGFLIAFVLSVIGVVVVGRDQIFIGAAVSQASMLGIALGIVVGESLSGFALVHDTEVTHSFFGGIAAVFGALVTALPRSGRESRESIAGWVFLLGASGSVLLVANSPHGLAEVNRLLASTIIGARPADVYLLSCLAVLVSVTALLRRNEITLLITDAEMAAAVGMNTAGWERALAVGLGATVAFSMHVAGMLYTFGLLVLPPMIAKHLCSEIRQMFVVAPAIALFAALISFVIANSADLPPAQVTVCILCGAQAFVWAATMRA
jgi:ABC-type Mn2+/Zn2+ transport system permease subunit